MVEQRTAHLRSLSSIVEVTVESILTRRATHSYPGQELVSVLLTSHARLVAKLLKA